MNPPLLGSTACRAGYTRSDSRMKIIHTGGKMRFLALILLIQTGFSQNVKITEMNWLLGKWIAENTNDRVVETWTKAGDLTFEGTNITYTNSDSSIIGEESLRLVQMSGEIFYIAKVKHNEFPIGFKLINTSDQQLIFENKSHDFPTQIQYKLTSSTTIEVVVRNKEKGFSFHFKKMILN